MFAFSQGTQTISVTAKGADLQQGIVKFAVKPEWLNGTYKFAGAFIDDGTNSTINFNADGSISAPDAPWLLNVPGQPFDGSNIDFTITGATTNYVSPAIANPQLTSASSLSAGSPITIQFDVTAGALPLEVSVTVLGPNAALFGSAVVTSSGGTITIPTTADQQNGKYQLGPVSISDSIGTTSFANLTNSSFTLTGGIAIPRPPVLNSITRSSSSTLDVSAPLSIAYSATAGSSAITAVTFDYLGPDGAEIAVETDGNGTGSTTISPNLPNGLYTLESVQLWDAGKRTLIYFRGGATNLWNGNREYDTLDFSIADFTLTGGVNPFPTVLQEPASVRSTAGQSVQLTATVHDPQGATAQWYIGQTGDTSQPTGTATPTRIGQSTLTVQPASTTSYWVQFTAPGGTSNSSAATVTVVTALHPPAFQIPSSFRDTIGIPFTYTIVATNSPQSFSATGLPTGLTINNNGVISGTPTNLGDWETAVTATNADGSTTANAIFSIAAVPPTITTGPTSMSTSVGGSATFSVTAAGTPPLICQWMKNGNPITGATSTTLVVNNAQTADAGNYSVQVINDGGAITSNSATLVVTASVVAPAITTAPASQSVTFGGNVSLSVVASGTAPLSYQWSKNGSAVASGTSSTLTLTSIPLSAAGSYAVTVSNSAGSVTSGPATLTVTAPSYGGIYFGQFAGGGSWALYVKPDNTGTLIAFVSASKAAFVIQVVVNADGTFTNTPSNSATAGRLAPRAVSAGGVTGLISGGSVAGSLNAAAISGSIDSASVSSSASTGLYQASALGTNAGTAYAIVGPSGRTFVVTTGNVADAVSGTVSTSGTFTGTAASGATASLTVSSNTKSIDLTVGANGTAGTEFVGMAAGVQPTAHFANLSVRANAGTGDNALILGFVVNGTVNKKILVRGIGPTLASFGVSDFVADPQLTLYNAASVVLTQNDDWGGDATLESAFQAAGAFDLPAQSKDAALLQSLAPGLYTSKVSAKSGSGVALIEAYDADPSSPTQFSNLSVRANAGSGEGVLTAGFVITGTGPQRVLIRGVGPGLTPFNVSGVLTDPAISLFQSSTVIAQNDDWGNDPALIATFESVGAFGLAPKDAALVVTLASGLYTAEVVAPTGTTGVALLEVYVLP